MLETLANQTDRKFYPDAFKLIKNVYILWKRIRFSISFFPTTCSRCLSLSLSLSIYPCSAMALAHSTHTLNFHVNKCVRNVIALQVVPGSSCDRRQCKRTKKKLTDNVCVAVYCMCERELCWLHYRRIGYVSVSCCVCCEYECERPPSICVTWNRVTGHAKWQNETKRQRDDMRWIIFDVSYPYHIRKIPHVRVWVCVRVWIGCRFWVVPNRNMELKLPHSMRRVDVNPNNVICLTNSTMMYIVTVIIP